MKLTQEYWIVESSQALQITEEQAKRMMGFVAIFPTERQALMFLPVWEKR